MRISLHTLGTRGDFQPFLALACTLQDRGHHVQLAAPAQFEGSALARKVAFAALPGEFLALLDSPEGKAAVAGGRGFSAGFKLLKHVGPIMRDLMEREWKAARSFEPNLFVAHPKSIAVPHIAEALNRPFVMASPVPGLTATSAYPSPMLRVRSLGPLNRPSHMLMTHSANLIFAKPLRTWRETSLGLSGRTPAPKPVSTVYAYSRHLLPRPTDFPASVHVTGFWFLDAAAYNPPTHLRAFLDAGEPPVAVGFGSLPGLDPAALTRVVLEGLAQAGKRGVLVGAGGALVDQGLPASAAFITEAPYDWLFERVSATLHHGGAGTSASALRAGKPIIACPFMADQPFWARRIEAAGFGPKPLDRRNLTSEAIAAAVRASDGAEMRRRTAEVGELIKAEGGVQLAADLIEGAVQQLT